MRHRKSGRQLNRNSSHRKAMFSNMASSLVRHELIKTTLPKAKELRRVIEPLITLAKTDSVANRRLAFARTRDNEVVAKLFNELGHVSLSVQVVTLVLSSVVSVLAIKLQWLTLSLQIVLKLKKKLLLNKQQF